MCLLIKKNMKIKITKDMNKDMNDETYRILMLSSQ
jgi:hypothetical protein